MVLAVVPFGNMAQFVAVNGSIIKLMLENGVSDLSPNGRFPAVHGIVFQYDPARPPGSRVTMVMVRRRAIAPGVAIPRECDRTAIRAQVQQYPSEDTVPLVADKEYLIVTLDFLLSGGDVSATLTGCSSPKP
jgi:hypothetical protein